jgi:hypothetical protein
MRSILVAAVAALALAGAGLGFGSAEASKPCITPGTGLQIGAKNMILSPMMLEIMAEHTAPQGDAGMATAVGNSSASCS